MDHYNFTLTRQYDGEEYCQTIRIKVASENAHVVATAMVEFLESAGFHPNLIADAFSAASRV